MSTYSIVLSGPAQARTKVERALSELPGIDVLQTTHHYGLEHGTGEKFITVEGDCDSSLPEELRAMNRANKAAEPFGWRLRMQGEKPEETQGPLSPLAELEARLARLEIDHGLRSPASMTLESPAAFNQNSSSYAAEQSRRAWFFPINTTGGVKAPGDLLTTAPGSGMSVNNAVGEAMVAGTESTTQGLYYARCSATQNTSVSTANPSNPRIDTVCATISDSGYTEPSGGSGDKWSIQVVAGTPTAGATLSNLNGKAALPASSLLLAYVLVPAATGGIITADIGDERVFALAQPTAWAFQTVTQTLTSGGSTITLGGNRYLTGGFSISSNKLVVPVAGTYLCTGIVETTQASDELLVSIVQNSSAVISNRMGGNSATGVISCTVPSVPLQCAAADTISLSAATTANSYSTVTNSTLVTATRVGP